MLNDWLKLADAQGETVFDRVQTCGNGALLELVLRQEDDDADYDGAAYPLHAAALAGNVDAINQGIAEGRPPGETDEAGETPLHKAARQGHLPVVEALLDICDANAANHYGMTPLHYTALNARADIAELLMGHHADASIGAEELAGLTPIDVADLMGHGAIKGLLEGEEMFF